jgi:hypothetical protein
MLSLLKTLLHLHAEPPAEIFKYRQPLASVGFISGQAELVALSSISIGWVAGSYDGSNSDAAESKQARAKLGEWLREGGTTDWAPVMRSSRSFEGRVFPFFFVDAGTLVALGIIVRRSSWWCVVASKMRGCEPLVLRLVLFTRRNSY